MSIESGQQVLPTEGFEDFADETQAEADAYEDQINDNQELNDENVAQLEADDPDDNGEIENTTVSTEGDSEEQDDSKDDNKTSEETDSQAEAESDAKDEVGEGDGESEDKSGEEQTEVENKSDVDADVDNKDEFTKKEKFERYSRSVQRKINREVKKRETLRVENEALRQRLDTIENRLSSEATESQAAVLANRLNNATIIKQQLMEDGEFDQVAKVDNDIIQMRIQQNKLEEQRTQTQDTDNTRTESQQQETESRTTQTQQTQQDTYVPDLQTQWIASNERFGKDAAYTNYVNSVYDALVEDGYDPESESLYEELNVRTGTKPAAKADSEDSNDAETTAKTTESKPKPKPKPRPQSAPTPNVTQAQKPARNVNSITEADKINMRNWGLDPNSKEVRKEWLANKKGKK